MAIAKSTHSGRDIKTTMRVAACLPSFNEANNIQNITKIVDRGLNDLVVLYPDVEAVIVNVDSNSSDGTAKLFIESETKTPKHSIIITEASGKGKNILEFCRYALSNEIDFCLVIDADIISAKPEWVTHLLMPLIEKDAMYVIPMYERSRFEGSSTNHFVFPFIYALSGKVVRQPIAGDFAFSRKIAQVIAESILISNESIQKYGIDTFMTFTAIGTGGLITQVDLGKKLHAPSFNKLEYMFPQIAASALLSANAIILANEMPEDIGYKSNILPDLNFTHKGAAQEMRGKALKTLRSLKKDVAWVSGEIIAEFIVAARSEIPDEVKMVALWTDVLSNWTKYFLNPLPTATEAKNAGQELLPFFVLRATSFWFWAETVNVIDVENAVRHQAELLRYKIQIT